MIIQNVLFEGEKIFHLLPARSDSKSSRSKLCKLAALVNWTIINRIGHNFFTMKSIFTLIKYQTKRSNEILKMKWTAWKIWHAICIYTSSHENMNVPYLFLHTSFPLKSIARRWWYEWCNSTFPNRNDHLYRTMNAPFTWHMWFSFEFALLKLIPHILTEWLWHILTELCIGD